MRPNHVLQLKSHSVRVHLVSPAVFVSVTGRLCWIHRSDLAHHLLQLQDLLRVSYKTFQTSTPPPHCFLSKGESTPAVERKPSTQVSQQQEMVLEAVLVS